jgi:T5SS/PEP-CTERM-associated repeat protein
VQDAGTMTLNGTSTFDNQADLNLVSGTLDFNSSATFNAGSRLDITGGTLDTTNQTLTVNGGTLNSTTSGALSSGSALRVQMGGTASFSSFFDIGNGNSAGLTVTGAGANYTAGGLSDWGRGSSGGAIVSVDSNAIATLNSLRIGTDNGSAIVTVASGGQLRPSGLTVGGGSTARTVNLTINGGTVTVTDVNSITSFNDKAVLNLQAGTFDPKGDVTFFPGSVANISGGTFLTASGKTLTVSGGTINRTNPAASGISPGATLAINSGGTYTSVGSESVGEFGAGTVTVDGTNSAFRTSTDLTLGGTSAGQVGTVTTTNGGGIVVGDNAGGFQSNVMSVGDNNTPSANSGGKLTIANGSTLNHHFDVVIAPFSNTFGTAIVTGANSRLNVGNGIFLGHLGGTGTLNITSGGTVTAAFVSVSSISQINMSGSSVVDADINNSGLLSVFDSFVDGSVTLQPTSVMSFDEATVGSLTQQAGADLHVALRGVTDFDNLNVLGAANLAGDLFVSLDNGFTPQAGNSFEFLTAFSGVSANFSSTSFPTLSGGLDWQLENSGSTLTLRVIGGIDGDFDNNGLYNCADINALTGTIAAGSNTGSFDLTGDGLVNVSDLDAWRLEAGGVNIGPGRAYRIGDANLDGVVDGSDFGIWNGSKFTSNTAWCSGNFNADGVVDGSDFGLWNGNKFTSSDGVSVVPEPSVLGGLLVALCGLAMRRGITRS